jgi:hypothetical protein
MESEPYGMESEREGSTWRGSSLCRLYSSHVVVVSSGGCEVSLALSSSRSIFSFAKKEDTASYNKTGPKSIRCLKV